MHAAVVDQLTPTKARTVLSVQADFAGLRHVRTVVASSFPSRRGKRKNKARKPPSEAHFLSAAAAAAATTTTTMVSHLVPKLVKVGGVQNGQRTKPAG